MKITSSHALDQSSSLSAQEIINLLLKQRDIKDLENYLNPPEPWTLSILDYGFKKELKTAFKLLEKIKEEKGTIVVYTDYDADGITGGAILWETLHTLGYKTLPFVPHRQHEGYGFSEKGIDKVIEEFNPQLIISVDHGIAAVEQVEYIKKKGINVIITDHHTKQETVPKADAVFHIPQLSGAGVAYYFAKEIFETVDPDNKKLGKLFKEDYVCLASIGAVADLVPLVGATRSLVRYGLPQFCSCKRKGLQAMLKEAKIENRSLTPFDIGFIIAPRINAIGRLEHALDALRLLCTNSAAKASELTGKLSSMNDSRKGLVEKAVNQAMKQVEETEKKGSLPKLIIVRGDDWHEGIIGLIASKLTEKYNRPSIVLTKAESYLKASARSPSTVNIIEMILTWKKYLLNFGGHKQAAGFSITEENYDAFKKQAEKDAEKLIPETALEKIINADIEIPLHLLNHSLAELLAKLEPFGIGNPRPSFTSKGNVLEVKTMGKKKNHLKIWIHDAERRTIPIEIVAFSKGEDAPLIKRNQPVTVVYNLELNVWNGKSNLQGKLIHYEI